MEKSLNARKKKILGAIASARDLGYDLTQDGVVALLQGELSAPWAKESPFYGCLVSLPSKQGKNAIRYLVQRNYLAQRYDFDLSVYLLELTHKGEEEVPSAPKKTERKKTSEKVYFRERKEK